MPETTSPSFAAFPSPTSPKTSACSATRSTPSPKRRSARWWRRWTRRRSSRRELIEACFELGIMGVEIPEKYRGAGATFFMSILVVEELARVDASLAVLVDVQNTLVNNALLRWGNEAQKAKYFPKLATKWVGAYALSEAGSG